MVFEKRNLLFGIFVLVLIGFLVFVLATTTTVQKPVAFGNYSGTMNVSVTTSVNASANEYNVSVYYNATGGTVDFVNGTFLVVIINSSASQSVFENATVNIANLTDGKIYNFSFYANNGTDPQWSTALGNITIDNTPPNVTFSGITNTVNYGNYSGVIVINVSASDATIGMSSVYFNITNSTSDQHNFTKASTAGGGYYNITLNTTTFAEGVYNITVYANDTQLNNLNSTEKIKITIDRTAPYEVNFTSTTVNNGNYSGNLIVNVSILDATTGIGTVFFNITNSSGVQNKTYTASKSGNYYNATIPTTSFPDGTYNITVWANDSAGNQNKTSIVHTITFDNTAPAVTVTSSSSTTSSLNLIVTSSDGLSGVLSCSADRSGATVTTSSLTESGLSCATSYAYIVTCTDRVGNSGSSSSTSFATKTCSSSSGSTTNFWTGTAYVLSNEQFVDGYTKQLKVKERLRFTLGNVVHNVGVRELTSTSATVEIASEPVEVKLNIGEDAKIDVDEDSFYDIYVKLNGITGTLADLTISYLHEEIPEGETSVSTTGEDVTPQAGAPVESPVSERDLTWLYYTLVGIVVVLIIFFGIKMMNRENKK